MIEHVRPFLAGVVLQIEANAIFVIPVGIIAINLLLTLMLEQRRRRRLGKLPAYVSWLEAKADLYETVLLEYAELPGGERAAAALAHFSVQQAEDAGETSWLPQR